jgi:hypothetical protein
MSQESLLDVVLKRDKLIVATSPPLAYVDDSGNLLFYGAHFGHMGPPIGYVPQPMATPQFNNPGPQISIPQPGNPVDQLSPLMGAGQPDALGIK